MRKFSFLPVCLAIACLVFFLSGCKLKSHSSGGGNPSAGNDVEYNTSNVLFALAYVPAYSNFPTGTDDSGRASVSRAFYLGQTEVTWELWQTVQTWAKSNGYTFYYTGASGGGSATASDAQPVSSVNWFDTAVWCNALTAYQNATQNASLSYVYYSDASYRTVCKNGSSLTRAFMNAGENKQNQVYTKPGATGFRLPTSSEWELAARWQKSSNGNVVAGFSSPWFTTGDSASGASLSYSYHGPSYVNTPDVAVWNTGATAAVASLKADSLGLYDMSGNVAEWCYDWYPGSEGQLRTIRGGSYHDFSFIQLGYVSCANPCVGGKASDNPAKIVAYDDIGFRICRTAGD